MGRSFQNFVSEYYDTKQSVDQQYSGQHFYKAIENQRCGALRFLKNPIESSTDGNIGYAFEATLYFGLQRILTSKLILMPQPGAIDFTDDGPDYAVYSSLDNQKSFNSSGNIAVSIGRGGRHSNRSARHSIRSRQNQPHVPFVVLGNSVHKVNQPVFVDFIKSNNTESFFNYLAGQRSIILSHLNPILQNIQFPSI